MRLGLRSSPWLGYASAGGDYLVPAALVTLGPSFGKKNLTGSPYLAMGAVAFGVGGRVSWLPWKLRYGKRFGLSADVMTFLPVGLGFAGSLEWTVQL